MNILLASTSPSYSNGASKCLVELAVGLEELGHKVIVTVPRKGTLEQVLEENGIRYYIAREYTEWLQKNDSTKGNLVSSLTQSIKHYLNILAVKEAMKILETERIDIVHVNAITSPILARAAKNMDIPLIWHIREFLEDDLGLSFYEPNQAHELIESADGIIAISEEVRKKWNSRIQKEIKIIYDGLPVDDYFIEDKPKKGDEINIIIYGRICKEKGQLFFLDGMNKIFKESNLPIHCYIAGYVQDDTYFKSLKEFVSENNLESKVSFVGETNDIKSLLYDMDITCVCSNREGLGRVTIESILAGCSVVGANSGATPEVLDNGRLGYLYEPDDNKDFIEKVLLSCQNIENDRKQIKERQNEIIKKFSFDENLKILLSEYERVLKRRNYE